MSKIYNPFISLRYKLTTGLVNSRGMYHNVVQKGNVGSGYIYALQHHSTDNYVFRARPQDQITYGDEVVKFTGNLAGGHTQTWEYANKPGCWFIGTKGKLGSGNYYWDTQIARVKIPGRANYDSNTELPRLSHLNLAGGFGLSGADLDRSEAAVSPNYLYFLVSVIDKSGNGYFSLYYLNDINNALDAAGTTNVNIGTLPVIRSFVIPSLTDRNVIDSIQGIDLDDNLNIYISSEYSPSDFATDSEPRDIYKIPWGTTTPDMWEDIDLTDNYTIDFGGHPTELESVQVISENHLYLTVVYHGSLSTGKWGTVANRIYEVQW